MMGRSPRSLRLLPALVLAPALSTPGCVAPSAGARGIALDDPLGLVHDVAAAGNPLRVYVVPASDYACNTSTGLTTPDIPDAEVGTVGAIVDGEAMIMGDAASLTATVPVGDWTVLVRGKGTDPVSGRMNRIIATGCATVNGLGASETRSVSITLLPLHDMGMCGDGTLSPDEQCEPPSAGQCDATCHTTAFALHNNPAGTFPAGARSHVRMASATGQRIAAAYNAGNADVALRMLDTDGASITTPPRLERDDALDVLGMSQPGAQLGGAPAMAADGHFAIAMENYFTAGGDGGDVVVEFFSRDRDAMAITPVRQNVMGTQLAPSAAYAGTGALMVVFEDSASATGLSGRVFATNATTASGSEAFPVGGATSGARHPIVAGLPSGFVVAFGAGGDVFVQRFAADGTAMDATAIAVVEGADAADVQDEPFVAASSDGSFLVAWTEHGSANGDGNGTTARARAFTTAGAPAGAALVLPSETASQAGDQTAPTVAAADGRYLVAWVGQGGVRARVVSSTGTALPNREQPQTAGDFSIATAGAAPWAVAMGASPASWLIGYENGGEVSARRIPR
ncbi:MAG: hypothetical protein U0234_05630 [Sandaracinus sp.]